VRAIVSRGVTRGIGIARGMADAEYMLAAQRAAEQQTGAPARAEGAPAASPPLAIMVSTRPIARWPDRPMARSPDRLMA